MLELVPLTDTLSLVPGDNGGRFPCSHSFYVRDDVRALIDTGAGMERLREFRDEYPVDVVINSHGHPDHTSGNWLWPDVPLHAPAEGAETHGRLDRLSHRFAEPGPLAQSWRAIISRITGFRDREPTDLFSDGHVFDFGHLRLTAVHTPGHTADHYCFFHERDGLLLSFDIDLTTFGPWYGHRESDLPLMRASLDVTRALQARVIASSHRDPIEGTDAVRAALDDYVEVLTRREARILELLASGATLGDLVSASPIYGDTSLSPEILGYWEGLMIEEHLAELTGRGIVRSDGGRYERCYKEA